MRFNQVISVLCLCVMLVMSGCAPYFRTHNLGDDTIQEYIQIDVLQGIETKGETDG